MKTKNLHPSAPGVLVIAIMLALFSCSKNETLPNNSNLFMISGQANGSQVVPTVNSTGAATITGDYNPTSRLLKFTTTWSGLSGIPTVSGFYSGAAGINGTPAGMPWSLNEGSGASGSYNSSVYLTPEQANELTSGNWYYAFSTASNPDGEVRGQITAIRE